MNPIEQEKLAAARRRAERLYKGPQFRQTYVKGAWAALGGKPIESCPYPPDPNKTWGRTWRRAWLLGYRSVTE